MAEGPKPKPEDILDGWKAIAEYLRLTERTVQRWEKSRGLPVRRFKGDSRDEQPRVFAYKAEIDAWWKQNTPLREELREDEVTDEGAGRSATSVTPPRPSPSRWLAYAVVAATLVLIVLNRQRIQNLFRPPQAKLLGVVPVRNLSGSGDPATQQLAEGLTEELISELGRLHPKLLGVKGLSPSPSDNSNLDYRLEVSVRRAGTKVAITAQLIQVHDQTVRDQTVKWGDSYERDLRGPEDIIPIELEIRDQITKEVLAVLPKDVQPVRRVNSDVYEAYLKGRFFWNKRTRDSLFKGISYFQKAIDSDPSYAPAYAGLADSYALLGAVPYTALPPNEAFPKSEAAARKALELDGSLAEANVSLGYSALVYRRDYAEAEKQFQNALRLRPEYANAHEFHAYYLTAMGRLQEATQERQVARDLEPLSPLMNAALGEVLYQTRQFDQSIEQTKKALELDPEYAAAHMTIVLADEQEHRYTEARARLQMILALAPNDPIVLAMSGHEYAVSGHRAEALAALSKLQGLQAHQYVSPLAFALIYIGLNDKNHAFEALDQAYDERSEYLVYLPTEPLADPLRSDPRFPAFLKRLGLTAPATSPAATSR
jgi:tetratricopeptide (TPR) repeat protein